MRKILAFVARNLGMFFLGSCVWCCICGFSISLISKLYGQMAAAILAGVPLLIFILLFLAFFGYLLIIESKGKAICPGCGYLAQRIKQEKTEGCGHMHTGCVITAFTTTYFCGRCDKTFEEPVGVMFPIG